MAEPIDEYFTATVSAMSGSARDAPDDEPVRDGSSLTARVCLALFDVQLGSRHLDLAARWLRSQGKGYYTIGSSGHEGNAAVAAALRPTDPALLHYRSGAFFLARAALVDGRDPLRDVLLGLVAATEEPISGGRHKVFGRHDLHIIPQTSTIASHLPRAVGVAFSIARAKKLGVTCAWPDDAVTVCSFGDASVNHSTAVGAINTALHSAYQGVPMPLLFVCEDNGIGISVKTPRGWIEQTYGNRDGLAYFDADGCDLPATFDAAAAAADWVRTRRRPAFLHLRMVRLMGHAGSDYEPAYRRPDEISADFDRDPLVRTAKAVDRRGRADAVGGARPLRGQARRGHRACGRSRGGRAARQRAGGDGAPCARPRRSDRRRARLAGRIGQVQRSRRADDRGARDQPCAGRHPGPLSGGHHLRRRRRAKGRRLRRHPRTAQQTSSARVFDTLLDEQSILGLALGAGVSGLLPIPEIQYLAYLHNAADQIRGEGATLQFFSNRQYRNPMVVRVAGYGYQKGFGGHFHNDNSIAAIRDIPGVVIASPARPDDAAAMLHTCAAAAKTSGVVCIFLEPIALYHTRDLHDDGDEQWLATYPDRRSADRTGPHLRRRNGSDDPHVRQRAADEPARCPQARISWHRRARRRPAMAGAAAGRGHAARGGRHRTRRSIVDETRETGGVGEGILAALLEHGYTGAVDRVASTDSFIPLGDAALEVLLSEETIEAAAIKLAG